MIKVSIGDILRTDRSKVKLSRFITEAGEGKIFETDTGMICKIYKDHSNALRQKKLELMVKSNISYDGICFPSSLVYDKSGDIIGYLMKKADTDLTLERVIGGGKVSIDNTFPHWDKRHLTVLALNILTKIEFLHSNQIILGDINLANILLNNERDIYFVDTDSYQIGRYPCPVGKEEFTAPEIQGKDFNKFFRTFNHEYFSIATLLFMILFVGKLPYTVRNAGSTTIVRNIQNRSFPYTVDLKDTSRIPIGYDVIWASLPEYIRQSFYYVFKLNQRKSTKQWVSILMKYLKDLKNGQYTREIFPRTAKNRLSVNNPVIKTGRSLPKINKLYWVLGILLFIGVMYFVSQKGNIQSTNADEPAINQEQHIIEDTILRPHIERRYIDDVLYISIEEVESFMDKAELFISNKNYDKAILYLNEIIFLKKKNIYLTENRLERLPDNFFNTSVKREHYYHYLYLKAKAKYHKALALHKLGNDSESMKLINNCLEGLSHIKYPETEALKLKLKRLKNLIE